MLKKAMKWYFFKNFVGSAKFPPIFLVKKTMKISKIPEVNGNFRDI
jgi:hypothetical protein